MRVSEVCIQCFRYAIWQWLNSEPNAGGVGWAGLAADLGEHVDQASPCRRRRLSGLVRSRCRTRGGRLGQRTVTAALVALPSAWPVLRAITVTVRFLLRMLEVSFRVAAVAPRISVPLIRHS